MPPVFSIPHPNASTDQDFFSTLLAVSGRGGFWRACSRLVCNLDSKNPSDVVVTASRTDYKQLYVTVALRQEERRDREMAQWRLLAQEGYLNDVAAISDADTPQALADCRSRR